MVAPEAALLELSGNDARIRELISSTGPLITPYEVLVSADGWVLDPSASKPTAPFDDASLQQDQRILNALLVACDYAVRRGAQSLAEITQILERESPIAIMVTDGTGPLVREMATRLGVVVGTGEWPLESFRRRARAHAESSVMCDPVLSFQSRTMDWDMGDNTLSSFLVHNEGELDGVSVFGVVSERWGVEVGLPKSTPITALAEIEPVVATMPSFLDGVTSRFDGHALEVGWAAGEAPEIEHMGDCMRVWTKALFDFEAADVRIVFAPPHGRSAVLTDMRARAQAFRLYRDAIIAGHPEPDSVVEAFANGTARDQ